MRLLNYTPATNAKGIVPWLPTSDSRTRPLSLSQEVKKTNGKKAPRCSDALSRAYQDKHGELLSQWLCEHWHTTLAMDVNVRAKTHSLVGDSDSDIVHEDSLEDTNM